MGLPKGLPGIPLPQKDMEARDMIISEMDGTTSPKRIKFEVELYGDTVCPWCYIGKKSLDSAIQTYAAKYPDDVFDVIWKPFILWPNIGRSSYDKKLPILKMFGPIRAPGVFDRLEKNGAEHGISFSWEGRGGNSSDSNKLVMLAYEKDLRLRESQQTTPPTSPRYPPSPDSSITTTTTPSPSTYHPHPHPLPITSPHQHTFLNALFHATFTLGFDPSDRSFLISLALSSNPPLASSPSELIAYLDSAESTAKLGVDSVRAQQIKDSKDISGVPSVVVQGRYRVGGMQKPEVYLRVFERVREGVMGVVVDGGEMDAERGNQGDGCC